jgi:ankyrin repeat protein
MKINEKLSEELHKAIEERDLEKVRKLLAEGAFVNYRKKVLDPASTQSRDTPLASVIKQIKKIKSEHLDSSSKEENLKKLYDIAYVLIDCGADRTDIGEYFRERDLFKRITGEIGVTSEEIRKNHNKIENDGYIAKAANENKELKNVYNLFYKYLQSKFTTAISILRSKESSGETKLISDIFLPGFLKYTVGNPINGFISSVFPKADVSSFFGSDITLTKFYSAFYSEIKEQARQSSFFINNEHIDYIASDFCARMTYYYRGEILKKDKDIGLKDLIDSLVAGKEARIKELVVGIPIIGLSALSGLKPQDIYKEYFPDTINADFLDHWDELSDRCIAQFFSYLASNPIAYDLEIGKKAFEDTIPRFNYSEKLTLTSSKKFTKENAHSLAALSQLVYESETKINEMVKKWELGECEVFDKHFHKSMIIANASHIILAFRGTHYHELQWLRDNFNWMWLASKKISIDGNKDIEVHKGFHDALLMHWEDIKLSLEKFRTSYPEAKIYITGHSLGGAMAAMCYLQNMEDMGITKDQMVLYTYGQPKWCLSSSHDKITDIFESNYYRLQNYQDPVPYLPFGNKIGIQVVSDFLSFIKRNFVRDILHLKAISGWIPTLSLDQYSHLGVSHYIYKEEGILTSAQYEKLKGKEGLDRGEVINENLLALGLRFKQHLMKNYLPSLQRVIKITGSPKVEEIDEDNEIDIIFPEALTPSSSMSYKPLPSMTLEIYASRTKSQIEKAIILGKIDNIKEFVDNKEQIISKEKFIELIKIALEYYNDEVASFIMCSGLRLLEESGREDYLVGVASLKLGPLKENILRFCIKNHLNSSLMFLVHSEKIVLNDEITGYTPIYYAVTYGNANAVEILTDKKVDLSKEIYDHGKTIFSIAASMGNIGIFRTLVRGCDPEHINTEDDFGYTPLSLAAKNNNFDIILCILINSNSTDLGTTVEAILQNCSPDQILLFYQICKKANKIEEIKEFDSKILSGFEQENKGVLKIFEFVGWELKLEDMLHPKKFNFNIANSKGNTLLYELILKLCLKMNDTHVIDDDGLLESKIEYIKSLCKSADVNYTDRPDRLTPLHLAISSKQDLVVKILLENNADYLRDDKFGNSPFDLCIKGSFLRKIINIEIVNIILKREPFCSKVSEEIKDESKATDIKYILLLKKLQKFAMDNSKTEMNSACEQKLKEILPSFQSYYKISDMDMYLSGFLDNEDEASIDKEESFRDDTTDTFVDKRDYIPSRHHDLKEEAIVAEQGSLHINEIFIYFVAAAAFLVMAYHVFRNFDIFNEESSFDADGGILSARGLDDHSGIDDTFCVKFLGDC